MERQYAEASIHPGSRGAGTPVLSAKSQHSGTIACRSSTGRTEAIMGKLKEFTTRHPVITSVTLWVLALLVTGACLLWQDKTGPTYPLHGTIETAKGPVEFEFLRSENIGTDLKVLLIKPVPEGVTASVKFRRYTSGEAWKELPFSAGTFEFTRRGNVTKIEGFGAELPSLQERAGKYEYFVNIDDGSGKPFSITGDKAILARYKGAVPLWVLAIHILTIFAAMLLAVRTTLEAIVDGNYKWMMWATIISFILGAFVLGPIVQWYAFRVWWSGFPLGGDWTDNKVVFELVAWLIAAGFNWGKRRNRWLVMGAGLVTLAVYFIPHSIFGSEYNYGEGQSRGTSG
jgi:hypothetical protein